MNDNPIEITSRKYPIIANMIFDGIGQENCEDIIWQNVIDTVSEIEQNEIGVSITPDWKDDMNKWIIEISINGKIYADPNRYDDEIVLNKLCEYYKYYYDKYNKQQSL